MLPTAHGLGSTRAAAPACRAATVPAPKDMPPWVKVGPSSTTRTRFPSISGPGSSVTGDSASMILTSGLTDLTSSITRCTSAGSALSTLLTTTTSALRTFTSPGW